MAEVSQVRIQLLSDLHLEIERSSSPLYTYDFKASAPALALLGDIGWTRDDRLFKWLLLQLKHFKRVFFVRGNHEPYVSTLVFTISFHSTIVPHELAVG